MDNKAIKTGKMHADLAYHRFEFIKFANQRYKPGGEGKVWIYDDHHLVHVVRGRGSVVVGGKSYPLEKGMVFAVPPFTEYVLVRETHWRMMNIHYRIWLAADDPIEDHWVLPVVFRPDHFERSVQQCDILRDYFEKGKCHDGSVNPSLVAHEAVLGHWLHADVRAFHPEPVDPRLQRLYARLRSPECTEFHAPELARDVGLSISRMNSLFRQAFGCSPKRYWNEQRLGRVSNALLHQTGSIGEIAEEFGFEDQCSFSRWFKHHRVISPLTYRRRMEHGETI
ncbi:MAG: helix-turn-helix domain-containing protein [Verrucomicrobiota bacterium]